MAIEVSSIDGVAVIQMTGETSSNSFSRDSLKAIVEAVDSVLTDDSLRAAVLTGEGRFFSAGADIGGFRQYLNDGTITSFIHDLTGMLHPLILRMRRSPKIFVAALNGAAAGGGLGLALACDARIAAPEAKLAAAFFKLGLSPDGGTTWLLPRLVGNQVTRRFFFNDEVWSGEEAQEKGAVDTVVAMDVLIDTAVDWAANWGKWSQLSRSGTKQLLDASTSTFFQTQLEFEQALIIAASQTKEFEEGVAAFLEKRDPDFD